MSTFEDAVPSTVIAMVALTPVAQVTATQETVMVPMGTSVSTVNADLLLSVIRLALVLSSVIAAQQRATAGALQTTVVPAIATRGHVCRDL